MRPVDGGTKREYETLRSKFQLLNGDRKASFEAIEDTKRRNDELATQLRLDNGALRTRISELRSREGKPEDDEADVTMLTERVHRLRTRYNQLYHATKQTQKTVATMQDQLKDLQREGKRPDVSDNPLTRKIRVLENRLDKAMIKYNETQAIRKTYDQIGKRLQEERVSFDNQLAAIERTLEAKQRDYDELLLLSNDARHARDVALGELRETERRVMDVGNKREVELKHLTVQVRLAEKEKRERAEQRKRRSELTAQAEGHLTEEEEAARKGKPGAADASRRSQTELQKFEEGFAKLKEATGVQHVDEVLEKITENETNHTNLVQLSQENAAKLEALAAERDALKARVEEIRYTGAGSRSGARKIVDELEKKMTQSTRRLEKSREKYERVQRVVIDSKAGIEHLLQKLRATGEIHAAVALTDETVPDVLFECQEALVSIVDRLRGRSFASMGAGAGGSSSGGDAPAAAEEENPFNCRIALPGERSDDVENSAAATAASEAIGLTAARTAGGADAVARRRVKAASRALVQSEERSKGGKDHHHGARTRGGGRRKLRQ
jgi:hypothetical protein